MVSTETQVRIEPGLLRRVLETSTESVEIDGTDGRVVLVSDAWGQLFDRDKQEVAGARWKELGLGIDGVSELRESWERCISFGRSEGSLRLVCDGVSPTTV